MPKSLTWKDRELIADAYIVSLRDRIAELEKRNAELIKLADVCVKSLQDRIAELEAENKEIINQLKEIIKFSHTTNADTGWYTEPKVEELIEKYNKGE